MTVRYGFIGPEPALGISARGARVVIRDWMSRRHEQHWHSIHGHGQTKGFLKRPSSKKAEELINLSRNQLRIVTGFLTVHCHLRGCLYKLGLVNILEHDRCKQAPETASYMLCDWGFGHIKIVRPGSLFYESR